MEIEAGRVELTLEPVGPSTSPLWNELIDRYHYLGYCRGRRGLICDFGSGLREADCFTGLFRRRLAGGPP